MESAGVEETVDNPLMKTLVVVEHRARELANRLWNDISIYAYGMEMGARVINTTFLEHIRFWRFLHVIYARAVDIATRRTCGVWTTGTPKFLPPTVPPSKKFEAYNTLYFFGWLFRNPAGLKKHRDALVAKFAPSKSVQEKINGIMNPLQSKHVRIGVHMRQRPFKGFENGEFLVPRARVLEIVKEYLLEHNIKKEDVALVEVSDIGGHKDDLTGLHLLSKCDVVIGTNSTFSNLSAWFGNVPHIVTTNEPIDWPYYSDKSTYFDNKYATFTHGSLLYP